MAEEKKQNEAADKRIGVYVVFLDVDGVLNPIGHVSANKDDIFPAEHVQRLKEILEEIPNAKFTLTTSWRKDHRKEWLLNELKKGGIEVKKYAFGETPVLKNIPFCQDDVKYSCIRRCKEIAAFLDRLSASTKFHILNWCALDDLPLDTGDNECKKLMHGHLVRTDPEHGLIDDIAKQVKQTLLGD